jgi:protein involved in polysaccharide export with SLBB domain
LIPPRGRRARIILTIGAAALLQPSTSFSQAQQQLPSTSVPQGSPLDNSGSNQQQTQQQQQQQSSSGLSIGSADLRPMNINDPRSSNLLSLEDLVKAQQEVLDRSTRAKEPPAPGEFEKYVERVIGHKLPRFGQDLVLPAQRDFAAPSTATVPPDYRLNVGDTVVIYLTGSVEGSVEREIDTNGNIFLPSVGNVPVAGVRFADLRDKIAQAIGRQYRGYSVGVGIKKLRGVRVYVTGFANNPGAFTVNSLSTIANAVFQAGGPSSGGSFRSVKLYRNGREVADFDLYELLRGGNRVNDAVLQNEDVLFIPPAGEQVAVIGSVHQEAIYEAKPGETLEQVLADAGGPNVLADASRLIVYHANDANNLGPRQVSRSLAASTEVVGGDIIQMLSTGSLVRPIAQQSVLVRVEGEVNRPGNYYVAPNTQLETLMSMAGGMTSRAYVFGTKLSRQSVRDQQREGYAEAIKQLELTLAAAPLTADSSLNPSEREAQIAGARAVLSKLKEAEPDGRVVLNIAPSSSRLSSNILLENNDAIYVPPRSTTVGVFGAVYRPASFNLADDRPLRIKDYVERAGGTIRGADRGGIFVVRANGEVVSRERGALNAYVLPGDVIFVPVKTNSGSFWTKLRELSTSLFQVGLSAATVAAIK